MIECPHIAVSGKNQYSPFTLAIFPLQNESILSLHLPCLHSCSALPLPLAAVTCLEGYDRTSCSSLACNSYIASQRFASSLEIYVVVVVVSFASRLEISEAILDTVDTKYRVDIFHCLGNTRVRVKRTTRSYLPKFFSERAPAHRACLLRNSATRGCGVFWCLAEIAAIC